MNYIFVDLDDTIINTSGAKARFFAALNELSQTPLEEIEKTYNSIKSEIGNESWIEQFTTALADQTGIYKNQVKDLLNKSFGNAEIDQTLMTYLSQVEAKKIILTYGNEKFQNRKIELLDLKKHFDEVIITADEKSEFFLKLIKNLTDAENIAIIDDNKKTLKAIKSQNNQIITYTKEQLLDFVKSKTQNLTTNTQNTIGGTI